MGLRQDVDDINRMEEIVKTFLHAGFAEFVERAGLHRIVPLSDRILEDHEHDPSPVRLRKALADLGPTFIKFGQALAQRPDLLPEEYIEELEQLEDHVNEIDGEKAVQLIEDSLGDAADQIEEIDPEPLASASIAQVHEARLASGERVAIKVRKPGVKDQIETDLHIMQHLVKEAERASRKLREMQVSEIFNQFKQWTREELDFTQEGRNADQMRENFEDNDMIVIPEVYWDLTTETVLTLEYIEGVKVENVEALEDMEIDNHALAVRLMDSLLQQLLRDGLFHGDPHPANILVRDDGAVQFLDFGIMGRLSPSQQHHMTLFMLHAAQGDPDGVVTSVKKLSRVTSDAEPEVFHKEIQNMMLQNKQARVSEGILSREFLQIVSSAANNGIILPTTMTAAGKSLMTVEGVGMKIYPEMKVHEEAESIIKRIVVHENNPTDIAKNFMVSLIENKDLIEDAPEHLAETVDRASGNQDHPTQRAIRESANKLSHALYAVALVASGTALITATATDVVQLIGAAILGAGLVLGALYLS